MQNVKKFNENNNDLEIINENNEILAYIILGRAEEFDFGSKETILKNDKEDFVYLKTICIKREYQNKY